MASAPMHRLFLAVWPDAATRAALAGLATTLARQYRGRWIKPHRYHLTLSFVGQFAAEPVPVIERLSQAAGSVSAPAFTWYPQRVAPFGHGRAPCVVRSDAPCHGLHALHASLSRALVDAELSQGPTRTWIPHVTLGHARSVATQVVTLPPWSATSFVLLHSVSGEASYREVARWPLIPEQ